MNYTIIRTNLLVVVLGVMGLISFNTVQPVTAAPITFIAQGTVNHVCSPLSGTFSFGDTFTVVYTFESLTPDSDPNPKRGYYVAITSLSVTVGTYSATAVGKNYIGADNDMSGGDTYSIIIVDPMLGPSVNGFDLYTQSPLMQLRDPSATVFTTDALPTSPPNPADFTSNGTFLSLEFIDPLDPDNWAFVFADIASIVIGPTRLSLDIKPGSCPNPLNTNTRSKGRLPMAILGTEDFDVSDIDPDSISIAGTVLPQKTPSIEDESAPVDGDECACQVSTDGINDLVVHFSRREIITALALDTMEPGTVVPITVEGTLLDGTPFEATDCVTLVPRVD